MQTFNGRRGAQFSDDGTTLIIQDEKELGPWVAVDKSPLRSKPHDERNRLFS